MELTGFVCLWDFRAWPRVEEFELCGVIFVIGFMDDPPSRAFQMQRLSSSDVVEADGDQDSSLDGA